MGSGKPPSHPHPHDLPSSFFLYSIALHFLPSFYQWVGSVTNASLHQSKSRKSDHHREPKSTVLFEPVLSWGICPLSWFCDSWAQVFFWSRMENICSKLHSSQMEETECRSLWQQWWVKSPRGIPQTNLIHNDHPKRLISWPKTFPFKKTQMRPMNKVNPIS